jgi:hypothetical protein
MEENKSFNKQSAVHGEEIAVQDSTAVNVARTAELSAQSSKTNNNVVVTRPLATSSRPTTDATKQTSKAQHVISSTNSQRMGELPVSQLSKGTSVDMAQLQLLHSRRRRYNQHYKVSHERTKWIPRLLKSPAGSTAVKSR